MTAFVLVSVVMLWVTPAAADSIASRNRWMGIAQIAIPCGLLTMSLTYFLIRRQR